MIIKGEAIKGRGLAAHLLKPENDRAEVLEMTGVFAANLHEAVSIFDTLAAGTKCEKPIYHAKLNPSPNDRSLTPEELEKALAIFEENMGLQGQPRIIVLHEKEGREHYHAVYSRINLETLQAVSDSWNYMNHEKAAREIEQALGLEQTEPCLYQREGERPERTPSLAEEQQGKRHGSDPKARKAEIKEIFEASASGQEFQANLEAAGYTLAKGDSRDFVIIDETGAVITARATGAKAAELRAFMADIDRDDLPSAREAQEEAERQKADADRQRREKEAEESEREPEPEPIDAAAVTAWKAAFKRRLAENRAAPAPTLAPGAEGQAAALGYLAAMAEAQNERAAMEPRPMHPDDHAAALARRSEDTAARWQHRIETAEQTKANPEPEPEPDRDAIREGFEATGAETTERTETDPKPTKDTEAEARAARLAEFERAWQEGEQRRKQAQERGQTQSM
jgi:hypothetical protein